MDRTAFSRKPGPETRKYCIYPHQTLPVVIHLAGNIDIMHMVRGKRDRRIHFIGLGIDFRGNTHFIQQVKEPLIKLSNGKSLQWHPLQSAITGGNDQLVIDKIKIYLEAAVRIWDRSCG